MVTKNNESLSIVLLKKGMQLFICGSFALFKTTQFFQSQL